jgi:glycosyltransferase involved in cell wall biosynthesis
MLPKISIITPSYNQARFLEDTIRSVLDQNYPNLEFIIIDGGSTDGSVEIIKRYHDRLFFWESKPDDGQYNAINKGFDKSTGEIMAWLCSDDTYHPGTLNFVGRFFLGNPHVDIILGGWDYIDSRGNVLWTEYGKYNRKEFLHGVGRVGQPAVFWRRKVYETIGPLSEEFSHWMDGEYFLRMGTKFKFHEVRRVLATYRLHPGSKSVRDNKTCMEPVASVVVRRYGGKYSTHRVERLLNLTYVFAKGKHVIIKFIARWKRGFLWKHIRFKLFRKQYF